MFKNEEGFSLLELVVAVGVAGIIAAVALPTFAGLQDKATTTSATYAASASAAEALANSTIGGVNGTTSNASNSGSTSSNSSQSNISGYVFSGTISDYSFVGSSGGFMTWSPSSPVLQISQGYGTYYISVAQAQYKLANMFSMQPPTVLSDGSNYIDAGAMGGVTNFIYLTAAPVAGSGAQIITIN